MIRSLAVTQKDVARACSVHPSTVCLALKNSPAIPEPTRAKIQTFARRLGYQPNASASNLAALRSLARKPAASLPIAWINQESTHDFWRDGGPPRVQWHHACAQASAAGYHLDDFWLHEPGMTVARLAGILFSRGITGVLFPIYRANDAALLRYFAAHFACVALNDYDAGEWADTVCSDSECLADATCDARPDVIAATAVDMLVEKMRRHELTLPENARRCLIKGIRRDALLTVAEPALAS